MKTKIVVAAGLVAVSAGVFGSGANAYKKNVDALITSVTCSSSTDIIVVSWDKRAGVPTSLFYGDVTLNNFGDIPSIPKSAIRKGSLSFTSAFDIQQGVPIRAGLRTGLNAGFSIDADCS